MFRGIVRVSANGFKRLNMRNSLHVLDINGIMFSHTYSYMDEPV